MAEEDGGVRHIRDALDDEQERLRTVEDLADEHDEEGNGQVFLDFGDTLSLTLRGKRPTESKIKFRTIQRDIKGQIGDKGDDEAYTFLVTGRLQDVQTPMRRDDSGRVVTRKRVHVLDPVDVQLLSDELAEEILTRLDAEE